MNYWQAAIEDVGPGGVDKGERGKYVVLPRPEDTILFFSDSVTEAFDEAENSRCSST